MASGCPYKKGKFGHRCKQKMPCEDQGKDEGDVSAHPGMSEAREEAWNSFSSQPLEGTNCQHLDFGFVASRTVRQ